MRTRGSKTKNTVVPQARDEGGEGDTNSTEMKQGKMNVGTGIPPFVSELGAALLDWSRGYLGWLPSHTDGRRNGRWDYRLIVDVVLDDFVLRLIQGTANDAYQPTIQMEGAKETYTSCSMIQLSRLDASCSRRLTASSRLLISRSRSAILSSRSRMSSARTRA